MRVFTPFTHIHILARPCVCVYSIRYSHTIRPKYWIGKKEKKKKYEYISGACVYSTFIYNIHELNYHCAGLPNGQQTSITSRFMYTIMLGMCWCDGGSGRLSASPSYTSIWRVCIWYWQHSRAHMFFLNRWLLLLNFGYKREMGQSQTVYVKR